MTKENETPLDEKLQEMLGKPVPPRNLEKILQANLIDQINEEKSVATNRKWKFGLVASLAANILLAVLIIPQFAHVKDDDLLNMAYEHVLHEEDLGGEFIAGYKSWFANHGISQPPAKYDVGLVKNCLIGLDAAKHMRLVNHDKKYINLLVFSQQMKGELPLTTSGTKGTQRWIKLDSPNGMQALAFYDDVISTSEVKALVRDMFKSKHASIMRRQDKQS